MNRNIKYKQVTRLTLFGDDDVNLSTNSQYSVGGLFTNAKRIRFMLNNALNDLKLSQNARCVVETFHMLSIPGMLKRYISLRLIILKLWTHYPKIFSLLILILIVLLIVILHLWVVLIWLWVVHLLF